MSYPTAAVNTTNADAGTDVPATFRSDVLDAIQKLNQMIAHTSAFAATLLDDANATAARATLGALGASDTIANATNAATAATCTGNAATASNVIGTGQTVQSVTRAMSTTYTNSTGKTIVAYVSIAVNPSTICQAIVGGFSVLGVNVGPSAPSMTMTVTLLVPNGVSYSIINSNSASILGWLELR